MIEADKNQIAWNEKVAHKIITNLKQRHMEGSYAATAAQARDEVLAMIPAGATVACCGSVSATSIGLVEALDGLAGVKVLNHHRPGLTPQESMEIRRQGLLADVMIASTNAITLDGRLVNLDGVGNRVAAMIFGPKKVILVVGMNKIAADLDSAIARVKQYSAPVNALRTGAPTPCAETGLCSDCHSPKRICKMWTIIEGEMEALAGRIHVKLVGENLGY